MNDAFYVGKSPYIMSDIPGVHQVTCKFNKKTFLMLYRCIPTRAAFLNELDFVFLFFKL